MSTALCLAQKMGKGLGQRSLLQ
ncbi:hypothetical protein QLQ17_04580 [Marinobacter sp. CHS3-4]|nr:hypothetical protein [Marinobacter sp. CHS3-4]MDI9244502.1 hypothetical protein [Marinobacter sp. CHS3-4]